ncbi:MAG: glycosyltransferase [Rhodospirillaceae bacterium]
MLRRPPAHLLHVFPSFQLGGSQRRFAALANHFGDLYRHTILSLDGRTEAAELLGPQVPHAEPTPPPKAGLGPALAGARRIVRALAPKVLVTYNWGAIEWAAASLGCGPRHLHIEDGFGPEEAHIQLRRRVLFRRLVLNLRSTVILPSHTLMNIAGATWRIAPSRLNYIPNGIPCAAFRRPADARLTGRFRGTGPVIGTIATLRKEKALDRLIEAFRSLRQSRTMRLVIVGDGPERATLELQAASSGLSDSVTFVGNVSRPEDVVGGFDIFAISSDTEQMPLSVLEAMAAGLPIAATDVGDIRTMVAPENLPYLTALTPAALAAAIGGLLADPELRGRIGRANQARATSLYDESTMFTKYGRLFSSPA